MSLKRKLGEVGEKIKKGGRWVAEKIDKARKFVKNPEVQSAYRSAIRTAKQVKPLAESARKIEQTVAKHGKKIDKSAGRVAAASRVAEGLGDSLTRGDVRGTLQGAKKIAAIAKDSNPRPKKKQKR